MTIRERAAAVILLAGAGSFAAAACTRAAGISVLAGGNASFVETTFATAPGD